MTVPIGSDLMIRDADNLPSLRELVWGERSGRGGGCFGAGAAAGFAAVVLGSLQQARMSSR